MMLRPAACFLPKSDYDLSVLTSNVDVHFRCASSIVAWSLVSDATGNLDRNLLLLLLEQKRSSCPPPLLVAI